MVNGQTHRLYRLVYTASGNPVPNVLPEWHKEPPSTGEGLAWVEYEHPPEKPPHERV
jgi:hypothetical protein